MKERYYYKIYADETSQKIAVDMNDLIIIDKEISPRLSEKIRVEQPDKWKFVDQIELARLLSISYYVLGGQLPIIKYLYQKPIKDEVPQIYSKEDIEIYNSYFLEFFLTQLKKFNRELGSWPTMVTWIRRKSLTYTFRNRNKIIKQENLRQDLIYNGFQY